LVSGGNEANRLERVKRSEDRHVERGDGAMAGSQAMRMVMSCRRRAMVVGGMIIHHVLAMDSLSHEGEVSHCQDGAYR